MSQATTLFCHPSSHGTLSPPTLRRRSAAAAPRPSRTTTTAGATKGGGAEESTSTSTTMIEQQRQPRRITLTAEELNPESFAPFGQVVSAEEDGVGFNPADAQLDLSQGTPRFYIMRLREKEMSFERITYHEKVTQCLGALGDEPWYMAVGAPTMDVADPPRTEHLRVFKVPPGTFVKMHAGTWHAGPLFQSDDVTLPFIDFYNLELSDTNQVDHNTWDYEEEDGLVYDVIGA